MIKVYETLWLENVEKLGVANFHVSKLLELVVKHINVEELRSYDRADVEIAIEHAQAYIAKDKQERAEKEEYVNSLIEKWKAEEVA